MLAAAPTGPRISAVAVLRYATIARSAMDQARGMDIPNTHAQRRVVGDARHHKDDQKRGRVPREQAQELVDLMKRPGLKEDTSLFSSKRSQQGVVRDEDGNVYFRGVGRPDGLGHGHAVIRKDGSLRVVRTPFDPLRYGARQAAEIPKAEQYSIDFSSTL